MEIEEGKWNYIVLRNPKTYVKRHENSYVNSQVEQKRFLIVKSNMYASFKDVLDIPEDICDLLGMNGTDDADEIILWDEWKEFEGIFSVFDVIYHDKSELFVKLLTIINGLKK